MLVSPRDELLRRPDGSYSIGCCDADLGIIALSKVLDDKMIEKVLCHELTHAAMFSYNINLTADQEELVADVIATYGTEIITEA